MEPIVIKILKDFSRTPGPRYITEGPFSGEVFRNEILLPKILTAIKERRTLKVDLDGTAGYGTSFLEEAFGGLIRENKLKYDEIILTLRIVSEEDPDYKDEVDQYLLDAHEQSKGDIKE